MQLKQEHFGEGLGAEHTFFDLGRFVGPSGRVTVISPLLTSNRPDTGSPSLQANGRVFSEVRSLN
jgi:hypothetical protein